jgi:hypothetical protein
MINNSLLNKYNARMNKQIQQQIQPQQQPMTQQQQPMPSQQPSIYEKSIMPPIEKKYKVGERLRKELIKDTKHDSKSHKDSVNNRDVIIKNLSKSMSRLYTS